MFRPLLIAVTLATTLVGCGQMEWMAPASLQQDFAAQARNPYMGLIQVTARPGHPNNPNSQITRRHLEAITSYYGKIWLLDSVKGFRVEHNTQQITNVTKLHNVLEALQAAQSDMEPDQAAQVEPFIQMLTDSLAR